MPPPRVGARGARRDSARGGAEKGRGSGGRARADASRRSAAARRRAATAPRGVARPAAGHGVGRVVRRSGGVIQKTCCGGGNDCGLAQGARVRPGEVGPRERSPSGRGRVFSDTPAVRRPDCQRCRCASSRRHADLEVGSAGLVGQVAQTHHSTATSGIVGCGCSITPR